jgi:DNA-binding transcriptional ArsR family regulator
MFTSPLEDLTYISARETMVLVHALDIIGDPVRRRLLELLVDGEQSAGALATVIMSEFGISQPAVSQHLRVLREHGFTSVRVDGTRRLYAVESEPLEEADMWLAGFRRFWEPKLAALGTEIARGKRDRRADETTSPPDADTDTNTTEES